jgi:CLIP-associating protein 1/2
VLVRSQVPDTAHMVVGLEDTSEEIVELCAPEKCIDSILEVLELQKTTPAEKSPVKAGTTMGLIILGGLLHNLRVSTLGSQKLSSDTASRMGRLAVKGLNDHDSEVRKAVIEYCVELYETVGGDANQAQFWKLLEGSREEHNNLLLYYLAKAKKSRTTTA